jgi:acetyl esterase/lipase
VVFDADYRKSPEHPFPAAIQDAEDITCFLAANSEKYDLSNIFLSGFSAGGNIALVTASALGPERVKGVVAFYPVVDLTKRHIAPEKRILAGGVIPAWCARVFDKAYTLPDQPWNDPRISVTLAPAESFPNHIYVVCGNADTLYESGRKFVEKLKEAGHKHAEFVGLEYMAHGFDIYAKMGTAGEEKKVKVYTGAVDLINSAIAADGAIEP